MDNQTKIISYYLPAFHEIEDNNRWYGKGFTEWDNTKKAHPLFKGHNQPRVPLNEDYYNLSDENILINQMKLAKENGIFGFCFYHYWFNKEGRTVLEKPLEVMLKNKSALIHYCFAWCNESWRRTWHDGKGESELLIEQKYEGIDDWTAHFNYLLKFFNDDFYIKVDNKPVFLVYKMEDIPESNKMINFFNQEAINNGFDGIFIIQMLNRDTLYKNENSDMYLDFEPNLMTIGHNDYARKFWRYKLWFTRKTNNKVFLNTVNYDRFCKSIVDMDKKRISPKEIFGFFCDWDNTPRKGRRGIIFTKTGPGIFGKYLNEIYNMSSEMKKPFLFLFAWNEWGEGGYLEPDEKNQYKYLEQIKRIVRRC